LIATGVETSTPAMAHEDGPLAIVQQWLKQAADSGLRRNPGAMALATTGIDGRAAVRMVLLKEFSASQGYLVFYSHYDSRKGRELAELGWAAGAMYWEEFGRQIRFEGPVVRSPAEESNAYFASRPVRSQLNAWASAQSEPLHDPMELERRAESKARELQATQQSDAVGESRTIVPRPPFWGGYRLWCEVVELWTEGSDRFHTRTVFRRKLQRDPAGSFSSGAWHSERLQP